MITEAAARQYLRNPDPTVDVAGLLATARTMVRAECTDYVPAEVIDAAVLQLISELDLRRRNPGGIVSYQGQDGSARLTRDPMAAVRPLLSAWSVQL